ncbi:MAG TPA: alpha/beta hydrolase [Chryseosolibacter sp.]|nr:alpha/beta hydrolase [Chryseosolibacter sp.]
MKNRLVKFTFPVLALIALYFVGPRPDRPLFSKTFPSVPASADSLEGYVSQCESKHRLKPENDARIVWFDSTHRKTEYAVVYLHGFSASRKEGDPVHRQFAETFGCNLYLARLADHGIDTTDALYYFSADRAWESAKQALAIGQQLGDKVIIMSTSTGGTLALMLAAEYPDKVDALINLSPNIAINDPAAFILNDPWGIHIARMVLGGDTRNTGADAETSKYWNGEYRIESLVQLEELLESAMTPETFQRVHQPSLTLYYYKSEEEQDPQVKVSAMLEMHADLATPDSLKVAKAMPDAGAHVIGSSITSADVHGVSLEIEKFAMEKLHMTKRLSLAGIENPDRP